VSAPPLFDREIIEWKLAVWVLDCTKPKESKTMISKNNFRVVAAVFVATLVASSACRKDQDEYAAAATELRNADGEVIGEATFEEVDAGVRIHFEGQNLPPGIHGFHIHENGECNPPTFESAGEHFNPTHAQHGLRNPEGPHAGDLPNLEVAADGTAELDFVIHGVSLEASSERSLLTGNGTALVVHADPDDQSSNPSGNSGDRIACGVIRAR
jgi:Cu-Zn family superoxide dismutase